MKKAVSFDLDGTLVESRYGDLVWNQGIPEEYSKKYGISFEEAKAFIAEEYRKVGENDLLWYNIDHWLERFRLPVDSRNLLDRFEHHIELRADAVDVLTTLGQKYTLLIASNAARIFVEKELSVTGITGHFNRIISATTDYRIVKKSEIFYKRLMEELGLLPDQIIHVGDHPVFDYQVPMSLGIQSYYISNNGRPHDDTIHNLRELLVKL